jgi:hypothetical protein
MGKMIVKKILLISFIFNLLLIAPFVFRNHKSIKSASILKSDPNRERIIREFGSEEARFVYDWHMSSTNYHIGHVVFDLRKDKILYYKPLMNRALSARIYIGRKCCSIWLHDLHIWVQYTDADSRNYYMRYNQDLSDDEMHSCTLMNQAKVIVDIKHE